MNKTVTNLKRVKTMKQKACACMLFVFVICATFMMAANSQNRIQNKKNVLLFVGKDPSPSSDGYVAYEIEKEQFARLPDWGPDTSTNSPPLSISSAVGAAKSVIENKYKYKGERVMLNEVVLLKAANESKNVWYYIVAHQVNTAKNPFYSDFNDIKEIRVVVLMDGDVVEPSSVDMSQQIRIQGVNVMINKDVIVNELE